MFVVEGMLGKLSPEWHRALAFYTDEIWSLFLFDDDLGGFCATSIAARLWKHHHIILCGLTIRAAQLWSS